MHAKEKETERFGIQEAGREDTSDGSDRNIFEDFVTFWYKAKFVIVWVVYGRYPDEPEIREVDGLIATMSTRARTRRVLPLSIYKRLTNSR